LIFGIRSVAVVFGGMVTSSENFPSTSFQLLLMFP
jgi:hypothetical protein